eukprot:TRINITY_DN17358_c0_g1_i1.p1 TRINITY_DN17358_c0_g1~~TRINITY_DN17358_c0_g1_i1.p1  ORF type:complete len:206 (+),score=19.66 TRINITY_DN17358_c0_g1_i1:44-619(+)
MDDSQSQNPLGQLIALGIGIALVVLGSISPGCQTLADLALADGIFLLCIGCILFCGIACCASVSESPEGLVAVYLLLVLITGVAMNAAVVHYAFIEELPQTCSNRVATAIGALAATSLTSFSLLMLILCCSAGVPLCSALGSCCSQQCQGRASDRRRFEAARRATNREAAQTQALSNKLSGLEESSSVSVV